MSDPRPDVPRDPVQAPQQSSAPENARAEGSTASQAIAQAAEELFPGLNLEPTDDSPTIISKNSPRPNGPAEHLFLGTTLRGRKLAHYELLEPIGVGGMAAVLRARDTQLDRTVALKILPPEMAAEPENIRRFHQEARAAAKLDH